MLAAVDYLDGVVVIRDHNHHNLPAFWLEASGILTQVLAAVKVMPVLKQSQSRVGICVDLAESELVTLGRVSWLHCHCLTPNKFQIDWE